jgi:ankyrin repeat protein
MKTSPQIQRLFYGLKTDKKSSESNQQSDLTWLNSRKPTKNLPKEKGSDVVKENIAHAAHNIVKRTFNSRDSESENDIKLVQKHDITTKKPKVLSRKSSFGEKESNNSKKQSFGGLDSIKRKFSLKSKLKDPIEENINDSPISKIDIVIGPLDSLSSYSGSSFERTYGNTAVAEDTATIIQPSEVFKGRQEVQATIIDTSIGNLDLKNQWVDALKEQNIFKINEIADQVEESKVTNLTDKDGNNVIHILCAQGELPDTFIRYFFSHLSLINAQNAKGETPLHILTQSGQEEALDAVLKLSRYQGLNFNIRNNDGYTPLELAALRGDYILVDKLIHSTQIGFKNDEGNNILHVVLAHGLNQNGDTFNQNKVVEILLNSFKSQNLESFILEFNNQGLSPIQLAFKNGNIEALEMLLRYGADEDTNSNEIYNAVQQVGFSEVVPGKFSSWLNSIIEHFIKCFTQNNQEKLVLISLTKFLKSMNDSYVSQSDSSADKGKFSTFKNTFYSKLYAKLEQSIKIDALEFCFLKWYLTDKFIRSSQPILINEFKAIYAQDTLSTLKDSLNRIDDKKSLYFTQTCEKKSKVEENIFTIYNKQHSKINTLQEVKNYHKTFKEKFQYFFAVEKLEYLNEYNPFNIVSASKENIVNAIGFKNLSITSDCDRKDQLSMDSEHEFNNPQSSLKREAYDKNIGLSFKADVPPDDDNSFIQLIQHVRTSLIGSSDSPPIPRHAEKTHIVTHQYDSQTHNFDSDSNELRPIIGNKFYEFS